MVKSFYIVLISLLLPLASYAQIDKKDVRKGNKLYEKQEYQASEIEYRKAFLKDSTSIAARYNLANNLFKTERSQEAEKLLAPMVDSMFINEIAPDYYHNLANYALAQNKYAEAIDHYKNSLRKRPEDMETKSNLAYAQKMLEDEQKNQDQDQNQDQNKDDNKDQDKDNNKNKDNKDDQNKDNNKDQKDNNKDQKDQKDENQANKPEEQKISPQAAQQMLKAIEEKEKKTQEKVKKEKAKQLKSKQKEKNW